MIDQFKEAFREEAYELLNELETSLLDLEDDKENSELISSVFRVMHTIKGSSSMFGYNQISQFTHEVESIMDLLRSGVILADKEFIDLTLEARDHIRDMLEAEDSEADSFEETSAALKTRFRICVNRLKGEDAPPETPPETSSAGEITAPKKSAAVSDEDGAPSPPGDEGEEEDEEHEVTYRIEFLPCKDFFLSGNRPLRLLDELKDLGETTVLVHKDKIPPLSEINPESCYTSWDIFLTTSKGRNAIEDVFIFVPTETKIEIQEVHQEGGFTDNHEVKRLGEILKERGLLDDHALKNALKSQKKIGEVLIENKIVTQGDLDSALEEQKHVRKVTEKRSNDSATGSIRVSSEKLDDLVDLVGEMVTVQARLTQMVQKESASEMIAISEQIERLTAELRENTMSIRMLPIGTTFRKFKRLVRDLSKKLNKQVELKTEGGDTELDKTVIERLNDPLVHIIRNSLDHGIETPEARRLAGKPEEGSLTLSAVHSGASVEISITDDGKGMKPEIIKRKAVEKGLISPDKELSPQEIYDLVFMPGFSTNTEVTSVSGRGVGMDVVKQEIEGLGGRIDINSEEGKGTSMVLKLPLTLAIIEGLLIRIKDSFFVIPLATVEECVEITEDDRNQNERRNITDIRGEAISYVRLREFFAIQGESPKIEQVVVVNSRNSRIGFVVDEVIGDYQTVIKNLGKMYRHVEGLSGATILGDGSLALIIDVQKIASAVQKEELEEYRGK